VKHDHGHPPGIFIADRWQRFRDLDRAFVLEHDPEKWMPVLQT
jgi:hypothetical protein